MGLSPANETGRVLLNAPLFSDKIASHDVRPFLFWPWPEVIAQLEILVESVHVPKKSRVDSGDFFFATGLGIWTQTYFVGQVTGTTNEQNLL